jgi:hypothetical protein
MSRGEMIDRGFTKLGMWLLHLCGIYPRLERD